MNWLLKYLTAEFLLDKHANSAEVIVARTAITSFFISVLALALEQYGHWNCNVCTWLPTYLTQVATHIPWLGAIAAAVYAAFYARFASQWSYLADLYNRVKQFEAELVARPSAADASGDCRFAAVAELKAGFIEDAKTLHLSTHKSFKHAVAAWAKQPCVVQAFVGSVDGEKKRLNDIGAAAGKAIGETFRPRAPLRCRSFSTYRPAPECLDDDQCSGFPLLDAHGQVAPTIGQEASK